MTRYTMTRNKKGACYFSDYPGFQPI